MDIAASTQRKLADEELRQHVAGLLDRYPNITTAQDAEVVRFLKKGPPVQVGLLRSDESIRPKLEAFERDHPKEFSLGMKDMLIVALIVGATMLVMIMLWDSGLKG